MSFTKEDLQKRREAKAYNSKLTYHLYQRMVLHPGSEQHKADYENRKEHFKAEN